MELLFADPYYDSDKWQEGLYKGELLAALADVDPSALAKETDVGHGADFPSVLVQLFAAVDWSQLLAPAAIGTLFLQGKRINENLDGWIAIAKKLKHVMRRVRPNRIDEKAAVVLYLEKLEREGVDLAGIQFTVQIIELTAGPCAKGVLDRRPDALYVITARIDSVVRVAIVKSSGAEVYERSFPTSWIDFNDI